MGDTSPCAWWQPLHPDAWHSLLTATNLGGMLKNSELELQAAVLGYAALLHNTPSHPHCTVTQGTDNMAAQSWTTKGSTATSLVLASRHFSSRLSTVYIPGDTNTIADLLSCSFHLSDDALLKQLNTLALHQPAWKLVTPLAPLVSVLNSAILNKHQAMPFRTPEQQETTEHGLFGWSSVGPLTKTLGCNTLRTQCPSSKSLHTGIAKAPWLPAALQSKLGQWRQPFMPWDRRFPYWDNLTPAFSHWVN